MANHSELAPALSTGAEVDAPSLTDTVSDLLEANRSQGAVLGAASALAFQDGFNSTNEAAMALLGIDDPEAVLRQHQIQGAAIAALKRQSMQRGMQSVLIDTVIFSAPTLLAAYLLGWLVATTGVIIPVALMVAVVRRSINGV